MCQRLSAAFTRPIGDSPSRLITNDNTHHHSDLVLLYGLNENGEASNFVRLEFVPQADGTWEFKLDQTYTPSWFTKEQRFKAQRLMEEWRDRISVSSDRPALIGGTHVISGKVKLGCAANCILVVLPGAELTISADVTSHLDIDVIGSGSVTIGGVYGSVTIGGVYGSVTIGGVSGSVKIGGVSGSVTIGDVSGSVTIGGVSGSVKIGDVYGSVTIGDVSGSVKIGDVYGSVTIGDVSGSVKIGDVSGSVTIGDVSGSVKIGDVSGSVTIGGVSGSVKIGGVSGSVKIGDVYGSVTTNGVFNDGVIRLGKIDADATVCKKTRAWAVRAIETAFTIGTKKGRT